MSLEIPFSSPLYRGQADITLKRHGFLWCVAAPHAESLGIDISGAQAGFGIGETITVAAKEDLALANKLGRFFDATMPPRIGLKAHP
jgi:hypothetical protein